MGDSSSNPGYEHSLVLTCAHCAFVLLSYVMSCFNHPNSPGDDFYLPSNPNNPNPGELSPKAYPCPIGSNGLSMTTLGRRATSQRACGECLMP